MIIDCAHYQDGRRQGEGPMPLRDAVTRCERGGFVWLGLFEPGPEELSQVREAFGLHELAVEDAQTFHMHIDEVEATVFSGASAPTERIYSLRRVHHLRHRWPGGAPGTAVHVAAGASARPGRRARRSARQDLTWLTRT